MIYNFHSLPYRDRMAIRTLEAKAARSRRPDMSAEIAYLREALERSREGWENVLELNLLPPQHRDTARALAEAARQVLQETTND